MGALLNGLKKIGKAGENVIDSIKNKLKSRYDNYMKEYSANAKKNEPQVFQKTQEDLKTFGRVKR